MKKNKKKRRVKRLLYLLLAVMLLSGTVILLFQTRTILVEGNQYYGKGTVESWIREDELSDNTLYIYLKYRFTDADLPSGVEKMEITLDNPWTVRASVTEKSMSGYVDFDGAYLYFDQSGVASLRTSKLIEGVPYVEGLVIDDSKVALGEVLPVEDDRIFGRIVDASVKLKKYSLSPDRLICTDGNITLYFGAVEVLIGSENYDERLGQVSPILAELSEHYPGTAGTLHLEKFDVSSQSVRFVPAVQEP